MARANNQISYAGVDSQLVNRLPHTLKQDARVTPTFEFEANPQRREERRAMELTEKQRRDEQDPGSMMVKLHKPFPNPKPKNHIGVLRSHFNQQWFQEMRRAQMQSYETQQALGQPTTTASESLVPKLDGPNM